MLAVAVYSAATSFPRGLVLAVPLVGAATTASLGATRRGAARALGLVRGRAAAGAILIVIFDGGAVEAAVA